MKQLFIQQSKGAVVEEIPAPTLGEGQVLVRNAYSLVSSGTESTALKIQKSLASKMRSQPEVISKVVHKIKSEGVAKTADLIRGKLDQLSPTGYSSAGTVVAVGKDVKGLNVGDKVACAGAGYANHAEVIAVPENLAVKIPEGIGLDESAFVALGGIAMHGVRRAGSVFGETVVVIGLGLIGQLTCQILKTAGCRVIGLDIAEARTRLAGELGADLALVPSDNTEQIISNFTDQMGADAVIICAGSKSSEITNQAMGMLRDKGRLVVVGAVGMALERGVLYEKELDFLISRSYGAGRYDRDYEEKGRDYPIGYVRWTEKRNMLEFLRMTADGKLKVKPLISKVFPLDEGKPAYDSVSDPAVIGVLFKYPDMAETPLVRKIEVTTRVPAAGGPARIAVIGGGSFAADVHLPNIKASADADLRAIVTATGGNAKALAKRFGASYCATDYKEVLEDPEVDAVIISTRHNLHAPIAIAAAGAKKHIFVEKPLALTRQDCFDVAEAVAVNKMLLMVGFNRRFAPFAVEMKKQLANFPGPKTVIYRVNAGPLPADHWLLDPKEGGGRILGEGCHFFDFACWLLDETPLSVFAQSAQGAGGGADDLSAIVHFGGGSNVNIIYNGSGSAGFSKERIEVYVGGVTIVIDDFSEMLVGGPGGRTLKQKADKGHKAALNNFIQAVRGKEDLRTTIDDGVTATLLSIAAIDSAKTERVVEVDWTTPSK
jgi:predicted dehydrogenase/threonine dehydrogenase-like Zn-dependent dehydrogenase